MEAMELFSTALTQAMSRNLSVTDLIRNVERLNRSGQVALALTLYSTWIQYNGDNPLLYAILFNYSVALTETGNLDLARQSLERALELNPDFIPAYINIGRIHERLGAVGTAITQWSTVLEKTAGVNATNINYKTTALNQSARALEAANQDAHAEDMLRQSLEIDPRQREVAQHYLALRQRQCKWPVVSPWDRIDRQCLMTGMSPLSTAAYTDDPLLQLAVAWNYNVQDVGVSAMDVRGAWPEADGNRGPLRVGYLSSDLREHAVGYLMAEVLGLHDRGAVEIYAYYCGPAAQDALHQNFQATSDHWVDISAMDDKTAAERIAADGIQILVDVNGYTREARTKMLALRPAPVIVNWLGFPGTMASPYHHYIIADDWIIPQDSEHYYSEKVLRVPCYQPNNRQRVVAPVAPTRAEAGLPEDGVVYCCFNGAHKINRFTFERWLDVLQRVPGSVLWLLSSTDATDQRLKDCAAARGIAPERIVFAGKLANPYHLARYPLADLFLDTAPYGAHTTASDALWMGVPVLTMTGRSFAARVCGSLVRSAGMPEMICQTPEEFVDRAVELGLDREMLRACRDRLAAGRDSCTLFDTPLLVRSLEGLYAGMWQDYCQGQLPVPDLTNMDVYLEVGCQMDHEAEELQTCPDYRERWLERLALRQRIRPVAGDARLLAALAPRPAQSLAQPPVQNPARSLTPELLPTLLPTLAQALTPDRPAATVAATVAEWSVVNHGAPQDETDVPHGQLPVGFAAGLLDKDRPWLEAQLWARLVRGGSGRRGPMDTRVQ